MYPIGPLSDKTLFQIHVEKIVAAARRYAVRIPLYLMTSPATHEETVDFFAAHERFGLPAEDLLIFCQGTMPAVDAETGRVLLEDHGRIAVSPDGHGGMSAALDRGGALATSAAAASEQLFYFQVDNPLVDICAAEMIGHHLTADSELSTQVVAKSDPLERVGNVVQVDGRLIVSNTATCPTKRPGSATPDGSLDDLGGQHRRARHRRRVAAALGGNGRSAAVPRGAESGPSRRSRRPARRAGRAERSEVRAVHFRSDAQGAERDCRRGRSPAGLRSVEERLGAAQDTPEMVREQMTALHRDWLREAGAEVGDDVPVEISPLFALDAEELAEKLPAAARITEPTYFQP